MYKVIGVLLFIYFIYCQDQMLFFTTEKYYCKKNQGNCLNCECWSCKRKEYIGFFDE